MKYMMLKEVCSIKMGNLLRQIAIMIMVKVFLFFKAMLILASVIQ